MRRQVTDPTGTTQYFADDAYQSYIFLSPSGKMIGGGRVYDASGTLVNGIDGTMLGWLDDDRALIANAGKTTIYDSSGNRISDTAQPLPVSSPVLPLSATAVYSPETNAVYDLSTGAATATFSRSIDPLSIGGHRVMGTVAAGRVIYEDAAQIYSIAN